MGGEKRGREGGTAREGKGGTGKGKERRGSEKGPPPPPFRNSWIRPWSCLIQLIHLNPNLITFGNTDLYYMISKPKFLEPEAEVGIRY